jgi:hypothetical protein
MVYHHPPLNSPWFPGGIHKLENVERDEMDTIKDKFHIEMRSYRIIGWGWMTICALGLMIALLSQQYWLAGGCVVSSLFGAHMVLRSGSFDIDTEGIIHRSSLGIWSIGWDEISRVEVSGEVTMVLHGENKRFILSSPGNWEESVKDEAFTFVTGQLEARHIPLRPSVTAVYKTMKNTRMPPDKTPRP